MLRPLNDIEEAGIKFIRNELKPADFRKKCHRRTSQSHSEPFTHVVLLSVIPAAHFHTNNDSSSSVGCASLQLSTLLPSCAGIN